MTTTPHLMPGTQNLDQTTLDRLEAVWRKGQTLRRGRILARRTPPLIRLWDGDWNLKGRLVDAIHAKFQWKLNDTGAGTITIPIDHWLATWALDHHSRPTKNIHITMDKDGARWSGRLKSTRLVKERTGQRYLELNFLHDYEELKHVYVWPNPLTPAAVQFPRTFMLLGPTRWALKTALMLNIWRLEGSVWALPDDPLDLTEWTDTFNPRTWAIQVAPGRIGGDTTPWTIISSRMKTWHDMAASPLRQAQLMVECRRYLTGDPLPWPGAKIRHGCLVVDIVDKSSWFDPEGTSLWGTIRAGFLRTTQQLVGHNVDTEHTVIANPNTPVKYSAPNWLGTIPQCPYVLYRDAPLTGIEAADFTWEPATAVQILTGGHSTYGVNEALSSLVTLVGNYLGMFIATPTIGVIADTLLKPFYEDTLLAWMSLKSLQRSRTLGWSKYWEHFADGADRGYTLSALAALREGFWDTREKTSHKLTLGDGAPWFIGDRGQGHFFLGDRIGATIKGLPGDQVIVEQVTEITYELDRDTRGWACVCGDPQAQHSPLEQILTRVKSSMSSIHDLGVI